MTADTAPVDASIPNDSQPRTNAFALASIVLAGVAVIGFASGGAASLAVFAVGAGHLALQQIKMRGERGVILAYLGLGVSYLIAGYALISTVYYAIMLAAQ